MKKLFTAIKKHDFDLVKKILEDNPNLIDCVAKQPPKSDDGKSLLQVAIKDGTIEIANYLLDKGANVNFMESDTSANGWQMPVIQDALSLAIMKTRWCVLDAQGNETIKYTKVESDEAFSLLKRMIDLGADLNRIDSKRNTTLERTVMQATQIMPLYNPNTGQYTEKRKVTNDLRNDLERIFSLLFEHGLTSHIKMRTSNMTIKEFYSKHPLNEFLIK